MVNAYSYSKMYIVAKICIPIVDQPAIIIIIMCSIIGSRAERPPLVPSEFQICIRDRHKLLVMCTITLYIVTATAVVFRSPPRWGLIRKIKQW